MPAAFRSGAGEAPGGTVPYPVGAGSAGRTGAVGPGSSTGADGSGYRATAEAPGNGTAADADAGTYPGEHEDAATPRAVSTAVRAPEIACHPGRRTGARRGSADPVRALMRHHRELCERAVDPLEIAAGLEAHGLTDRAAARYRHRDVFSLAEELYARVPGADRTAPARPSRRGPGTEARVGWTLLAMLPGAGCLATAGVLRATEGVLGGEARFAVTAVGALLVLLALRLCLRGGPLRTPGAGGLTLYVGWLLGYTVYGDDLLAQVVSGGPDGDWTASPVPLLGLATALVPAAWCAHLFAVHAHRRLVGSHVLADFGAGVRPLLFGVVALQLCATTVLLHLAGLGHGGSPLVAPAALGVLLFLARLLAVHGFPEPAATGLAAACTAEVSATFLVLAGRLPGLGFLARPVDVLVARAGTGAVPALACGVAALGLLLHASVTLTRASAHATA
ncbi:hypothetical protein OG909_21805 [Streptomyces sp. NBC_01754]|uniref:hypothetical protein n=1 Tax=Streptomyces sp. NBC_01754 TaxID=2975930 RepID=UPI002DD95138|nr:hypothetical protein [Streptomyces sp. NBC_01754]WSC94700.1 hypothetical protein OG909_21805 [Streptomyces sp. NBC_01754]